MYHITQMTGYLLLADEHFSDVGKRIEQTVSVSAFMSALLQIFGQSARQDEYLAEYERICQTVYKARDVDAIFLEHRIINEAQEALYQLFHSLITENAGYNDRLPGLLTSMIYGRSDVIQVLINRRNPDYYCTWMPLSFFGVMQNPIVNHSIASKFSSMKPISPTVTHVQFENGCVFGLTTNLRTLLKQNTCYVKVHIEYVPYFVSVIDAYGKTNVVAVPPNLL